MNKLINYLKNNKTAVLFSFLLLTYIFVAGRTGSCSACSAIVGFLEIPSFSSKAYADENVEYSLAKVDTKKAPTWQLPDLEGKSVSSSDFEGKVVFIDFWATWCPPCRKMIPGLVNLDSKYKDKGLEIIGISLDRDGASAVLPFNKKFGVSYVSLIGDREVVEAFGGVEGIPTSFLIDRKGNIVQKHVGYLSESKLEKEILKHL